MIVNRTEDQQGPATLTIYFREEAKLHPKEVPQPPSSTNGVSKAPVPATGETAVTIDIKGVHSTEILTNFMQKTAAEPVKLTPQEEAEIEKLADLRRRGEIDRAENAKILAEEKREKARLAMALSEAAAIKAAI